jgi:threonine/homoserine/homoserine lactone efflux protein
MISIPALLAWTALAAAVTISPGPDTLLVAGNAMRRGSRAGLLAVAGIVTGGVFYAALCGLGFLSALAALPVLYWIVKISGAVYLAIIGALMLRDAFRRSDAGPAKAEAALSGAPFRQGLLTNALNPKVALFYLAALPQFTGRGPDAPWIGVMLIAIHYAMGALWLSGIALTAGRAGAALKNSAVVRWLHGVIGTLLIGIAGKLAFDRR